MLVLTRKLQQKIKIGEAITVTILRVKGQTVRVGIEAPRDVRVVRGELPGGGQPEALEAAESTIIETRLTITDEVEPDSAQSDSPQSNSGQSSSTSFEAADGTAGDAASQDAGDEYTNSNPDAPLVPRIPLPLRLPQRRRFSRTDAPPLRVAHGSSATLAK